LLVGLLALGALAAAGQGGGGDDSSGAKPSDRLRPETLERFRKMDPGERLKWAEKTAGGKLLLHSVKRGDVDVLITERGSLDAADASDVICRLKAQGKGRKVASTIKWLVEDGTQIKKGQRVVELDDTAIRDQLLVQKIALDQALADKAAAEENFQAVQKQNQIEVRMAEINLRLAKLRLKKYAGKDEDEKEILALKAELAQLNLEAIKHQIKTRMVAAETQVKLKAVVAKQEAEKRRELEVQLAHCVITAPQDGMVVYVVPEQLRFGGVDSGLTAIGEPVREGQKLMRVVGLKRFVIQCKVHEALIHKVRVGQPVSVRADAFPRQALQGRVMAVSPVASQKDWLTSDVKVYPVQVALTGQLAGIKPGMSGDVRIEVEHRGDVLRVPVGAVLRSNRESFCLVKVGKGLEERAVKTGARNHSFVEIHEGLKEGDRVFSPPHGLAALFAVRTPQAAQIVVRSIRPSDNGERRRVRVQTYGLTYQDLQGIKTFAHITEAIPVRSFPVEARYLERAKRGRVIATGAAYPKLAGIRPAAGRFLDDEDDAQLQNVAVLGAELAASLFPNEDPMGKTLWLGTATTSFRVIGILRKQEKPAGSLTADEVNHGVYIPLSTCQVRFGARLLLRRGGSLSMEAVALSEILVAVDSPRQVPVVVKRLAALLAESHERKDWDARAAADNPQQGRPAR
jgi:multidrug efflux pump subunit AcrA (membrane-fusion protein)